MRPTTRTLILAAVGFATALLPILVHAALWPAWLVFWGALALLLGIDAVLSPGRRRVGLSLTTPEVLYIGQAAEGLVTLRFAAERPIRVTVTIDLSDDLLPQPPLTGVVTGEGRQAFRLEPRRRGKVTIDRAWIRYPGPLGLIERIVVVELGRSLPVLPDIGAVKAVALMLTLDRDFRQGLKIERYQGDGTEFDSLREYSYGDDPQAIHWKASARHRRLVCRQFRAERNHQVVLAVDTGHLMALPLEGIPRLDHAVNAALILAYVCLKSGDRVGLYSFDARVGTFIGPQAGMPALARLTHATSQLDYSPAETNFTLGLTTLGQHLRRRSLIIVLTDFVDTVTAELMIGNLDRLAGRHLVIFVSLRDPRLEATVHRPPDSLLEVNQAVMADSFLRDREVVIKRLARLGIHSLDTEPGRLGPGLVSAYLDIKRRELI